MRPSPPKPSACWGPFAGGEQPQRERPVFSPAACTEAKPLDQAHVVLSFQAPGYRDPDIYVLQVLSNILGGGMSSRLFQEVREKRGLCYSVFSFARPTRMRARSASMPPPRPNMGWN